MEEFKKCIHCKSEMNKKANICPNCSKNQIPGWYKTIIFLIIFSSLFGFVIYISGYVNIPNSNSKQIISEVNKLTLFKFNSIKIGMSYEDVVKIIGENGILQSEVDMNIGTEYKTKMYMWYGQGDLGANANFTFQGNKLISKAQFGLK